MMLCHWVSGSWHFQGLVDPWRWWHHAPQNIRNQSPDDSFTSQKTWTLLLSSPLQLNCISNLQVVTVNISWWWCSPGYSAIFTLLTFPVSSYGHFKGFVCPFNQYLITYFYSGEPLTHQQILAFWKTWNVWNRAVRTLDVTNKKILQGARSETKSRVVQVFVHG